MSDARRRALERAAEHDPDAEARLFEEHVRRGDLAVAAALLERFPDRAGAALAARLAAPGAQRVSRLLAVDLVEHARARPAMYVGSSGPAGLRAVVEALVEASVERRLRSPGGGRIDVELRADGTVVVDDDDGAPNRWRLRSSGGATWTPAELTDFDAEGPGPGAYRISRAGGGGLAIANALSAELSLQFRGADGSGFEQRYARGRLMADGRGEPTLPGGFDCSRELPGSRLAARPDPEVFGAARVDADALRARLVELAPLVPHVSFSLARPDGAREAIRAPEGLAATVRPRAPTTEVVSLQGEVTRSACRACGGTIRVAAAVAWRADAGRGAEVQGWANGVRDDEGAHVGGLRGGAEAALARAHGRRRRRRDPARGLVASVSVLVPRPTYLGSRRERLGSPEVAEVVAQVVAEQLGAWFALHPREAAAWR